MKYRLFGRNFFLVAVLVCVTILNFYPQRNYNAVMNSTKNEVSEKLAISTTDDVAEQVLVKSADDVAGRAVVSSVDDIVGRTVASSTDDIAVSATAGSRQAEKQLLSGSEWNEYFQQTYGAENVQWATQGQSSITNATKGAGKAVSNKSIVIGEGMQDIKTVAKQLQSEGVDAKWYQAWSKNFPNNRPMTPDELNAALARNQRWIDSKIKQGYDIYDIGTDPLRTIRSPFYELEQSRINKYGYPTIDITGRRP